MPHPPNRQSLLNRSFYGWLLLSLGLHGVILGLPFRQRPPAKPEAAVELPPAIAVSRLPQSPSPPPVTSEPSTPSTPQLQPVQPQLAPSLQPSPAPTPETASNSPETSPEPEPPLNSPEPSPTSPTDSGPSNSSPPGFNAAGTTDGDAVGAYGTWTDEVIRQFGLLPEKISPAIVIEYPIQPDCRNPEPVTASVGVVAEADGTVLGEPQIIKNTGYSDLDAWIVDAVKDKTFTEAAGERKALTFEVELSYTGSSCDPPSAP